jgi:hypothetical protein
MRCVEQMKGSRGAQVVAGMVGMTRRRYIPAEGNRMILARMEQWPDNADSGVMATLADCQPHGNSHQVNDDACQQSTSHEVKPSLGLFSERPAGGIPGN